MAIAAAFAIGNAHAQAQYKNKKAHQPTNIAKPAPVATPTGPSGFGAIKIGMTQESLEKLKAADGVYLVGPFVPHESSAPNRNTGESLYTAVIATPFDREPREASFTFVGGALTGFLIKLDDTSFAQAKSQLVDKFGPGKPNNDQHEEQCVYGNGAAFKVTWGTVAADWDQRVSDTERITSSASELTLDSCPPRLDMPHIKAITSNHISIRLVKADPSKPNLF
ncbi:hypothetical protein SAMN02787148_11043 [Burkholderia vietnamiensis]|nr:hypothetical protein EC918_10843 [Burkholderia vietnamiensis]SCZ33089.1 hypothetical protein SAMN02787148_11043 [Burkholderia vietnamiensis]SFX93052.1 hypothetical protein SAMN02787160_11044 [Burkholderia vietnamiensis]